MKIAIIMGSDSDWNVMQGAADICNEFEVDYEAKVVSAHRTPEDMVAFAQGAVQNGFDAIIAGAGGAAHLPGMVASCTTLPTIGVPVGNGKLSGLDSLLSIVQMPKGIPVATVAIDNSANAALLALRILSVKSEKLRTKLEQYAADMKEISRAKTVG